MFALTAKICERCSVHCNGVCSPAGARASYLILRSVLYDGCEMETILYPDMLRLLAQ